MIPCVVCLVFVLCVVVSKANGSSQLIVAEGCTEWAPFWLSQEEATVGEMSPRPIGGAACPAVSPARPRKEASIYRRGKKVSLVVNGKVVKGKFYGENAPLNLT